MAGVSLSDDEVVFYVLNGLDPNFNEIVAAIRARESCISFAKLHDKLVDYEDILKRRCSSSIIDASILITLSPIPLHLVDHLAFPTVMVVGSLSLGHLLLVPIMV